jgi:PAS domain-containing protein
LKHSNELAGINASLETEIVERKRAEHQLAQEGEFLAALLNNLSEGIVACDKDGAMTVFNRVMGIIIASIAIEFILNGLAAKFPVLTQTTPL